MAFPALIPAFLKAAPYAASLLGGLFGKKKSGGDTVPEQTLLPSGQQQVGDQLGDYIQKYLSQYEPGKDYEGQLSAPIGEAETTGMDQLNKFLSSPDFGSLFGAGEQQLLDTLGGRYSNPAQSPYIQSATNLSRQNLQDTIDQSRRSAGSRGSYFSRSAIQDENRLRERSGNYLDTVIGDFINQERGRQMEAVPLAQQFDQYRNLQAPLTKIEASQTFGSLPRLLQQADLERQYKDFGRQQSELSGIPGQAQSYYGQNTPYVPSTTNPIVQENNTLGNILSMISKLNLSALSGKGNIADKLGNVFRG